MKEPSPASQGDNISTPCGSGQLGVHLFTHVSLFRPVRAPLHGAAPAINPIRSQYPMRE
jgi:hypothetical protein